MKEGVILLLIVLSMTMASAATTTCDMTVTLLSQDPYPSVPGDYTKLVFQLDGINNANCGDIKFELLEEYPITFDPGKTGLRTFKKIDYVRNYQSSILIPYEVRIDDSALDGTNTIDIKVQSSGESPTIETLNIEVEDVRADFEVYVKDYNYATNELTLEILNIEKSDIEALSVEIPKQDIIEVKGASRIVVGDLDSNEYTTADFEAVPQNGEFKVSLTYSDSINIRRTIEKTVNFDSSYFTERKADQTTTGAGTYIFWAVIIILVGWWITKKFTKKKKK